MKESQDEARSRARLQSVEDQWHEAFRIGERLSEALGRSSGNTELADMFYFKVRPLLEAETRWNYPFLQKEDAAEVLSTILHKLMVGEFPKFLKNRAEGNVAMRYRAYLVRAMRNACIDRFRQIQRRSEELLPFPENSQVWQKWESEVPNPRDEVCQREDEILSEQLLTVALVGSNATSRKIVSLWMYGQKPREIASLMSLPLELVNQCIRKGRRALNEFRIRSNIGETTEVAARIAEILANRANVRSDVSKLSPKLRDVAQLIGCGMSETEIAKQLNLPLGTVRSRRAAIAEKLAISTLQGAFPAASARIKHS